MATKQKSRQEIMEMVGKLHRMAESAQDIGNEEEAQAFASKVQELLTAYKLSMADISNHADKVAEEPINMEYVKWSDLNLEKKSVRVPWAEHMAVLIAKAYYCHFIIPAGHYNKSVGNMAIFVGAETDRKVCVYMYITLGRFLHSLAEREMHKFWMANNVNGKLPENCKGFRAGFIAGFIKRLGERFDEELKPKGDPSRTMAIVHVKHDALRKASDWMKANMQLGKGRNLGNIDLGNAFGRARGKQCADEVNLNDRPIEKTGKTVAKLAAGGGR